METSVHSRLGKTLHMRRNKDFLEKVVTCSNGTAHKTLALMRKLDCNDWHCLHEDKRRDSIGSKLYSVWK